MIGFPGFDSELELENPVARKTIPEGTWCYFCGQGRHNKAVARTKDGHAICFRCDTYGVVGT